MGFFDRIPGIGNDSDEQDKTDRSQTGNPDDTGDGADDNSQIDDDKNNTLNYELKFGKEYLDGSYENAREVPHNKEIFNPPDNLKQHFDEELGKDSGDESSEDNGSDSGDESSENNGSDEYEGTKFNPADVQPARDENVTNEGGDGLGSKEAGAADKLSKEDIEGLDAEQIDVTESEAGASSDQSMDI